MQYLLLQQVKNASGQYDVSDWTDIKTANQLLMNIFHISERKCK